jgi:hypothetical protein
MSKGLSFESFAAVVDVHEDSLWEWAKKHKDFSDAKKEAFAKSRLFWEQSGIEGLWGSKDGPNINSTVWIFNMKNRFGWRDSVDHNHEINIDGIVFESDSDQDDE